MIRRMNALDFPFQYHVEIIFHDLDAMGHVNNARHFVFMETARMKYLLKLFASDTIAPLPIILADAQCSYKSPALLGEELVIGVGISRLGHKSFDMAYTMQTADGRLVATAKSVQVMYDYASEQTIPIPDKLRQTIHTYQQQWQPPS